MKKYKISSTFKHNLEISFCIKYNINLQVVCRSAKNKNQCGYATIVSALGRESKQDTFASCDYVKQCLIAQWFDYAVLFVGAATNSKTASEAVLQELNDYLLTRSYLVGQSLTLADVALFYSVYNLMVMFEIVFAQTFA